MTGFPVRRDARDRYAIEGSLIAESGDAVSMDLPAIRRIADRMNAQRADGAPAISAGEIAALLSLHEFGRLLIERFRESTDPDPLGESLMALDGSLREDAQRLLDRFAEEFPGQGPGSLPLSDRVEQLILTRVANENPAIGPLRELVDDRPLERQTRYRDAIVGLERAFTDTALGSRHVGALFDLLRAPARHAPTSLSGQLRYVRAQSPALLGADAEQLAGALDLTIGILAEEARALHLRFGGGGHGRIEAPTFHGPHGEAAAPEAFSPDAAWMPRVVLMAKSTYVWLDQLSRQHDRAITTLDAIPDEELDTLAGWGVTGLWLIGLWQRSVASERIKRMRGNPDAVASAYSLDDYRIADDLGGEDAYASLRDRAADRGLRLASDMVPNHMGIDSRWLIEHPEWFLSVGQPPYPAYSFAGPDLSPDERVGIVLEDHYWNDTDAAVVFKRIDRRTSEERYVYHGNDGTSFPWNDTAQLDFLDPAVREQVIRTVIAVARRFPIIRFDAAMVLAKKHVQRLWWPEPGSAGGIPSRAEFGSLPRGEFDERMPAEFWREVVDRVTSEVPGTLLLAEAFWLLEGYFVRTLGMHRVYNSAFMHMLRDEDGAGYRRVLKETLEFDPHILERYVNFMTNPDEETALEQFGTGDKYFGVALMLATLPGLPMLGHGQIQGWSEKYGMEFRRATRDERPDRLLIERHEREVFPVLRRRAWFAEARDFLLYDLEGEDGTIIEDVFAYSNGTGAQRTLVLYHNRFGSASGRIRLSAPYAVSSSDGSKRVVRRSLAEGLGLPHDAGVFVAFRDGRTGPESIRSSGDLWERGLRVSLGAYECHLYWEFRELRDGVAGDWARLAERLGERGVPSLDAALWALRVEPAQQLFRALFDGHLVVSLLEGMMADHGIIEELERRLVIFLAECGVMTGGAGDPARVAGVVRRHLDSVFHAADASVDRADRAVLLAWLVLAGLGWLADTPHPEVASRAAYDELGLREPLVAVLRDLGFEEYQASTLTDQVRALLASARPSSIGPPEATTAARLLEAWLADDAVRAAMGVNTWQGVEWLDGDRFTAFVERALRVDALEWAERALGADGSSGQVDRIGLAARLSSAAAAAGYRVEELQQRLRQTGPRT